MKLWIVSTRTDLSLAQLVYEAKKQCEVEVIYFERVLLLSNHLSHGFSPLFSGENAIGPSDRILIRWPFNADDTNIEYHVLVRYLLMYYEKQIVFDRKCLKLFSPYYEDKLFQFFVFQKLNVPTPKTYYFSTQNRFDRAKLSFPLVLKKRVSSRSKNNFLISSREELHEKLTTRDIREYIFQDVVDVAADIRLLMLKKNVLGVIKRYTHIREGNRIAVSGREEMSDFPKELLKKAKKIQTYMGADFVGFDILIDRRGSAVFIEANLSPQFNRLEKASGKKISEIVIKTALV